MRHFSSTNLPTQVHMLFFSQVSYSHGALSVTGTPSLEDTILFCWARVNPNFGPISSAITVGNQFAVVMVMISTKNW
jgi:hypothetical protein